MTKTVLILGGTGKIGRHCTESFLKAGWTVSQFNRANDNMTNAARGCDVIINGLNPPYYHDWKNIIPKITQNVITAAKANNACVIIPGNIYHFGNQKGILSQNTHPIPNSRKGQIRLEMEQTYEKSGVQTIVLRAGNFIDPELKGCVLSEFYLRQLKKNIFLNPGPNDVNQAFCYLPDWAKAAEILAQKRHQLAPFEDIPFPGYTLTADELRRKISEIAKIELNEKAFPWWLFKVASPFWELARELNEMRYLWEMDHQLCPKRFTELLPEFKNTPLETYLKTLLDQK